MDDLNGKMNEDSQFLSFQDFSPINRSGGAGQAQLELDSPNRQNFGNLNDESTGINMIDDLQSLPRDTKDADTPRSFWTIEYYQKYFNVDTEVVIQRIKRSMIPHPADNYLISQIRPNPDLYGPFWICVTLVFSVAMSGNIANYLQTANSLKFHWKYDFHMVSYAATCIFLYAWLLPVLLWGALRWTNNYDNNEDDLLGTTGAPGMLELLCLYGYSLAIYIPITFLWTIQISWMQWSLVGVVIFLPGAVLLHSLMPIIRGKQKPIFIAVIFGLHVLLAVGFMLYFFYDHSKNELIPETVSVPPMANANLTTKITAALPESTRT